MKSIDQQLSEAGITYKIYTGGVYIEHYGRFVHGAQVTGNKLNYIYLKAIQLGLIEKPNGIAIATTSQDIWEQLQSQESPYRLLNKLGFIIIDYQFDSMSDIFRIEVLTSDIQLPNWVKIFKP